jgi:hypothetical protein
VDQDGEPRLERTQTKDVNRHGARITSRSYHPLGSKINLGITHLGRSAHCRVVWCSAPSNGSYEVGIELETPENVWGVPFESTNWSAGLDPATALWTLVQMLEEKGIISREELRNRVLGGRPPNQPGAVIPWTGRRV